MIVLVRILSWENFVPGRFCPGRILSRKDFFCPQPMQFNGYLDDLWYSRVFFFPGRILSSAYSLHYYLHSLVAMIVFGRILSWEDFVLCLCNSMVSLMIYGFLEYFFSPGRILSLGDFILGKILSPTHALLCCATIVFRRIMKLERFCLGMILSSPYALYYGQHSAWLSNVPGGFCPGGGFCPQPTHSI